MKIVVNRCFGGFGLSPLAIKEYLKLKGKKAFFYEQTKYDFRNGKDEYKRVDELKRGSFTIHAVTKDLGETINKFPKNAEYFYDGDISRTDKDLITVVEKLKEKANGDYASLEVVEIPDGIDWEIDEYDGSESVEEKHRSW